MRVAKSCMEPLEDRRLLSATANPLAVDVPSIQAAAVLPATAASPVGTYSGTVTDPSGTDNLTVNVLKWNTATGRIKFIATTSSGTRTVKGQILPGTRQFTTSYLDNKGKTHTLVGKFNKASTKLSGTDTKGQKVSTFSLGRTA